MTLIISLLFLILFIAGMTFAADKGAIITITTIKGVMFGSLIVSEDYEEDGVTTHIFQICLLFITFTAQWETEL